MKLHRNGKVIRGWLPSRRWLFLPPLVLGIGVVAWLASQRKELPRTQKQAKLHVNVMRMQLTEEYAEATGFGTAQALRTWTATAEVGGRIQETRPQLRNGIAVEPNELLLSVDPEDYEIRLKQRSAEVVQTQSQLDRIKIQAKADQESLEIQTQLLAVRKNDVERNQKLRNGIASSEAELDLARAVWLQQAQSVQNLKSTIATYPAQIASAEASLAIAQSALRSAERDVERTEIRAPFRGILTGVSLEEAQYVAPNQQLFQVIDTAAVEITAQFSLAQLRNLVEKPIPSNSREMQSERSSASFVSSALLGVDRQAFGATNDWLSDLNASVAVRSGKVHARFPARVERVTGTVDEQTRTLGIVVRVDNEVAGIPFALTPGTYCEITLTAAQPTLAHVVPRNSLEGDSVLVVDDTHHLSRRNVELAFSKQESVAVAEGLSDGDLLVVNPSAAMRAGSLVAPQVLDPGDCGTSTSTTHPELSAPSTGESND